MSWSGKVVETEEIMEKNEDFDESSTRTLKFIQSFFLKTFKFFFKISKFIQKLSNFIQKILNSDSTVSTQLALRCNLVGFHKGSYTFVTSGNITDKLIAHISVVRC